MPKDLLARIGAELSYRHDTDRIATIPIGAWPNDLRAFGWSAVGLLKASVRGVALGAVVGGVYSLATSGDLHAAYSGAMLVGFADAAVYEIRAQSSLRQRTQQRSTDTEKSVLN